MNTWKVIVATLVIFVAGVVTGALLAVYSGRSFVAPKQHPAIARQAVVPSPGVMRLEFLRRVQRELELTSGQREHIDQILKESQEHIRKIEEPVMPGIREEMRRTREAFREVLTPEQRARFDESFKHQTRPHATPPKQHPAQSPPAETTP